MLSNLIDSWISRWAKPDAEARRDARSKIPLAVITGGSRGIGLAIAKEFAQRGKQTLIIARGEAGLQQAAHDIQDHSGIKPFILALDVTRPDAAEAMASFASETGGYVDILVNNAGLGLAGPFVSHPCAKIDELIALNVAALTRLTRHALPGMLARAQGGILNIASLGGAVPGPNQAAYYASKAYVISLTEAIAQEIAGRGVRVAVVVPGPVNTGFHEAMHGQSAFYRRFLPVLSPIRVARSAVRGFNLGRRVIAPDLMGLVGSYAVRALPHPVTVPVLGFLLKRRDHDG